MKKTLLLSGVACLLSTQANAETIKPYLGFDLGVTKIEYSNKIGSGHTDTMAVADINFGLKFNQYFGVELSSQASSESDVESMGDLSYSSIGIDAVGYIPLNTKLELFAMAGVGYYDFDLKINRKVYDLEVHAIKHETAFRGGLGLQYNINEKWALRGMARYHYIDNDFFDYIGEAVLGVRYTF